jgi:nicotinamidase-related amidase
MKLTALLVIDAQVNMFDPQEPVYATSQMLTRLQSLIRRARESGIQLVYLRNNGDPGDPDAPGTPGWEIHPALAPQAGEPVIDKFTPNGFEGTDLGPALQQRQIRRLVLAGMQTDFCVAATLRGAVASGYEVTLVADAHSTYDSDEMKAGDIIARYNRELETLAEVIPSQEVKF